MTHDYLLKGFPASMGPIHAIKEEVCLKYGITMTELLSRRRLRTLAFARFEGYWRARNETTASLPEIARAFGRSDHTTIMHGVERYEQRLSRVSPTCASPPDIHDTHSL